MDYRKTKYYKKMTSYRATGLAEGFEEPEAKTPKQKQVEELSAWQYLVDTGQVWGLQGWFGRSASDLLKQGVIKYPKGKTKDYYGNPIPTSRDKKKWK
jgi:hypothetical protein